MAKTHAEDEVVVTTDLTDDAGSGIEVVEEGDHRGLKVRRYFTQDGTHPYDELEWELRDAVLTNWRDGTTSFEQRGVEFPKSWSMMATQIVSQKYFRGTLGTPERESSVKHMIDRVADTITGWGLDGGYFADEDSAEVFNAELKHLLVRQKAAFNSPVWFNVGVEEKPQCSACQPWGALVSTPGGFVPIGEIVDKDLVGMEVFDSTGTTRVVATKHNGTKRVHRVTLRNGSYVEATADHVVRAVEQRRTEPTWVRLDELREGMRLHLQPHRPNAFAGVPDEPAVAEAALAGWLQADGFVGQYDHGTNRSLTLEFQIANSEEEAWIKHNLDVVFPDVHRKVTDVDGIPEFKRIRLYGEVLRPFVERYGLLARRHDIRVPTPLWTASGDVVAAYLRSVFQADGYVTEEGGRIGFAVISEAWTEDLQLLLLRLGIYSRRLRKNDHRDTRSDTWSLDVCIRSERERFAAAVGFVDARKRDRMLAGLELDGKRCPDLREEEIVAIDDLGEMEVYDIQTESGEYLSNSIVVHNCFILAVEDTMSSILNWYVEEGTIFKGGSGAGINLSTIRSSKEILKGGGEASGPVSFMRGADASAGTIKSGGKTRRAAKMVILNVDHPDVEEFIWTKAREEKKVRVLREAGFDMDLDGEDYASIQYQNANNSVRVTDEFMRAFEEGTTYPVRAVTTGEVIEEKDAREVMRQISEAAWACADPGLQYDTTINDWHTSPESGRINGSNPCFPGDALVHTDKGLVRFDELIDRVNHGEAFGVYTHDATSPDEPSERVEITSPEAFMLTGTNEITRLTFSNGMELRCTPGHRIWTTNRGYVEAQELTGDDQIKILNLPAPAVHAEWRLPISSDVEDYRQKGDHAAVIRLPDKWTEDFAHYLGWLVGDGSISGDVVSAIYGTAEEQEYVLPRHRQLVTQINDGREPTPSEQPNGTVQLRQSRRAVRGFLEALGLSDSKAADKRLPWSVREAPPEALSAFLQGLFDADGCVSNTNKSRYVGLGSRSLELLRDVQVMLTTFGIHSRVYTINHGTTSAFTYTRKDGSEASYDGARTGYDLRISGRSIEAFATHVGFSLASKTASLDRVLTDHIRYRTDETARLVDRTSEGFEQTYNLSEPRNHSYVVGGVVVRNCSEYMHLDNSACNLASLNLKKFYDYDAGRFDVEAYKRAIEIVFTAQEIIVGYSSYPTEKIGKNAIDFRELGLGYANLGGLLMSIGLPYDSEEGRAWCGALTALMTGHAYRTSAELAKVKGPHNGYAKNAEPMLRVIGKHRAAVDEIDPRPVSDDLLEAARTSWDEALELGGESGFRNAQASVIAPTGTIGLMMDCDTTGIEPDLGLVKMKKMVGGASIEIVNQSVPSALQHLGYEPEQVEAIIAYVAENKAIHGAPALKPEHTRVFQCAMGDDAIHYMGHVGMMAAAQPFISGAISKCVVGDTLISTEDGLVRIDSLYDDEEADSFREHVMKVASLDGMQKTDAFYYGGIRPVREVVLRSGHRVVGTPNHRLLVATDAGLAWKMLHDVEEGDHVAQRYGAELWSQLPARIDSFEPSPTYGSQKSVRLPSEMNEELAFLLGAFVAEGHIARSTWTATITNADEGVLERVAEAISNQFGIDARIVRPEDRCSYVAVSSKTVVELLVWLGCGEGAANKRVPDAVLRSPRSMVLSFLQGLALDAYTTSGGSTLKWAICLDSTGLLDDLQALLTNLGVVHSRITKHNTDYDKDFDEVYVSGGHARHLIRMVPFVEADKAARAQELMSLLPAQSTADVVPGITPQELYAYIPYRRCNDRGQLLRTEFNFLADARTKHVSRATVERVAAIPGIELPDWLHQVVDDGLHFSPVVSIEDAGEREVYDISVPGTHAFVGNGIVNHNTVNLPEEATVEDVEQLHLDAWKMGIKAIAIYRDNCKVAQPLSVSKKASAPVEAHAEVEEVHVPRRRKLPKTRPSQTISFRVGDAKGYITAGEYPGDGIGELFVKLGKQGSTLSGLLDAFAISMSIGLQYGVPLEAYVSKFMNMRFEPAGMTDDPEIRFSTSIVDFLARKLALEYLPYDQREMLGIYSLDERTRMLDEGYGDQQASVPSGPTAEEVAKAEPVAQAAPTSIPVDHDAPMCFECGIKMKRAGACHVCESCGTTSGCS